MCGGRERREDALPDAQRRRRGGTNASVSYRANGAPRSTNHGRPIPPSEAASLGRGRLEIDPE